VKRFDRLSTAFSAGKGKKLPDRICAGSFRKNCDWLVADLRRIGVAVRPRQKSWRNLAENFDRRSPERARPRGARVCAVVLPQNATAGRTATFRRRPGKNFASVGRLKAIWSIETPANAQP